MAYIVNDFSQSAVYGEMYIDSDAGSNTSCTADTPTTLTGFSAGSTSEFTFATNELTYTGSQTRTFWVTGSFHVDPPNNAIVNLRVTKNGTAEAQVQSRRKHGNGVSVGSASISGTITLSPNDVVDIEVESSATGNVTSHYCNLSLISFKYS